MNEIEKLKSASIIVNNILNTNLSHLSYFDNTNLMRNYQTFKKVMIEDGENFFSGNQIALYISKTNTLAIDSRLINENITIEMLVLILLHECLHMASFDSNKTIIGYENEAFPVTFNESCTQFLALKLMYEYGIKIDNFMYVDSVNLLNKMILDIDEEILFSGFFKADLKLMLGKLSNEKKSKFIDYILQFSESIEEKKALEGINNFNDKLHK